MTATITNTHNKPWDLSLVLEFANSFTLPKASDPQPPPVDDNDIFKFDEEIFRSDPVNTDAAPAKDIESKDFAPQATALGDFGKVWQFLGVPNTVHESTTSGAERPPGEVPKQDEYASDGATYTRRVTGSQTGKERQWSDGTDASGEETSSPPAGATPLTKSQRKKANRRARKLEEQRKKDAAVSESEADPVVKQTPARQASAHHVFVSVPAGRSTPGNNHLLGSETASAAKQSTQQQPAIGTSNADAVNAVAQATARLMHENVPDTPSPKPRAIPPHQRANQPTPLFANVGFPNQMGQARQQANAYTPAAHHLLPASVNPMVNGKSATINQQLNRSSNATPNAAPATANTPVKANTPANASTPKPLPAIKPMMNRPGEQRHLALLTTLIADFPQDLKYFVNPMNLTTHNNDPKGIHVFVDYSNIFIGFMDQLKTARGIFKKAKVDPADFSYDSLALILERRRPVAKRVLVGSTPHMPAFDKAKAVGYECSILEKVYKARELTDRKKFFQEQEARRFGRSPKVAPPCNTVNLSAGSPGSKMANGSGSGSGSETNTPQYAPAAMIEQGVDEILHLKMMESLVDYEEPSTMVVATGDAAAAEYSEGFMRMVQRALMKGWEVELVCWSMGLNRMYTRPQWTQTWGDKFRIAFLDPYVEELLDM